GSIPNPQKPLYLSPTTIHDPNPCPCTLLDLGSKFYRKSVRLSKARNQRNVHQEVHQEYHTPPRKGPACSLGCRKYGSTAYPACQYFRQALCVSSSQSSKIVIRLSILLGKKQYFLLGLGYSRFPCGLAVGEYFRLYGPNLFPKNLYLLTGLFPALHVGEVGFYYFPFLVNPLFFVGLFKIKLIIFFCQYPIREIGFMQDLKVL